MPNNRVTFTVEFDAEVWNSMTPEQRTTWMDDVTRILADEVQVTDITVG